MNPKPSDDVLRDITRRWFFRQAGFGIGALALGDLASSGTASAESK